MKDSQSSDGLNPFYPLFFFRVHMKKFIGRCVAHIGAVLWQNGGWTGDERYEDLSVFGKVGFKLFCTGIELMGLIYDDISSITNN